MKILIVADIFPPQSGGPATYSVLLANKLTEMGDEVKIVSLNPDSKKDIVSCDIDVVKNRNKILKYLEYIWLLKKNTKKFDVIYAMGPVNAGWPACLAAKLRHKKLVVKVVGDYAWEQWQNTKPGFVSVDDFQNMKIGGKIGWLKKKERKVVKAANKVIVPSKYLKGIVEKWGAKNVNVIYNEVDYVPVEPIEHQGEKWIVSVGRLTSWKGMDTLIEIMPDLLKEIPNLKLKIVGDGPVFEDLRKQVKDLKLENIVELTGKLAKKETLTFIASANIFVLNSGYEGLSHVLIEAMSQGVPFLASRMGGNGELAVGDALFEYNNKEEIKEKILRYIDTPKKPLMRHSFGGDMIKDTRKILQEVCQN